MTKGKYDKEHYDIIKTSNSFDKVYALFLSIF